MPLKLNRRELRQTVFVGVIALLTFSSAFGQSAQESEDARAKDMRQMWKNVVKRRPQRPVKIARVTTTAKNHRPQTPQPEYKITSSTIPAQGQDLGITVWRLRPSRTADAKEIRQEIPTKRLRHKPNNMAEGTIFLTAERVEAGTQLHEGDLIQLSVESPQKGFLYVIDRERYADANRVTYGAPYLIFPTTRTNKGFNGVRPGILINIPAMTDDPFYFELNRSNDHHVAEELTFVVSPTPITWQGEQEKDTKQIKLDERQFEDLAKQMMAETGRIELAGGAGKAQTAEEAEAAKASSSDGAKRLKHKDPLPQTIYRVARKPREPFIITILLRIAA